MGLNGNSSFKQKSSSPNRGQKVAQTKRQQQPSRAEATGSKSPQKEQQSPAKRGSPDRSQPYVASRASQAHSRKFSRDLSQKKEQSSPRGSAPRSEKRMDEGPKGNKVRGGHSLDRGGTFSNQTLLSPGMKADTRARKKKEVKPKSYQPAPPHLIFE